MKKGYGNLYSEKVKSNLLMNVAEMETIIYNAIVVNKIPLEFIKYLPPPPFPESVVAGKGKPPRLLVDMFEKELKRGIIFFLAHTLCAPDFGLDPNFRVHIANQIFLDFKA